MDKKIAVIGSNSFSGASFCQYLLKQGHEVTAISRSNEAPDALLPYKWVDGKLDFFQLDLNKDLDEIDSVLDKNKTSHVFNFAAQSMVGQSWQTPEHWFMTNVVSTVKLHNKLREKEYLERYIHVSTPEVYGSCTGFVDESQPFNPSTPYAVSRAAADMSLNTFYQVHGFPFLSTRAANVYGEGQQLYRIIPKTIISILKKQPLMLHGGGLSERSFIHIDDVCAATYDLACKGSLGECYHISTKRIITIRGLVELICQMMGENFDSLVQVTEDRAGKDAAYLLDTKKIENDLAWQPNIELEKGIERTIAWARKNAEQLISLPDYYIHRA